MNNMKAHGRRKNSAKDDERTRRKRIREIERGARVLRGTYGS